MDRNPFSPVFLSAQNQKIRTRFYLPEDRKIFPHPPGRTRQSLPQNQRRKEAEAITTLSKALEHLDSLVE